MSKANHNVNWLARWREMTKPMPAAVGPTGWIDAVRQELSAADASTSRGASIERIGGRLRVTMPRDERGGDTVAYISRQPEAVIVRASGREYAATSLDGLRMLLARLITETAEKWRGGALVNESGNSTNVVPMTRKA